MGKQHGVVENSILDDLGTAVPENVGRQGIQSVGIAQHQTGLAESPGQVFTCRQINGSLAAYRGIHSGQQGGGYLHEPDAPQEGRRREPGQVAGNTAAQCDDHICAGQAALGQKIQKLQKNRAVFAFFPGGKYKIYYRKSGAFQTFRHRFPIQGKHGGFADHADFLSLSQLFHLSAQLRQQPAANENVVGFGCVGGHSIHPSTSSLRFLPSSRSSTSLSISLSRMACWYCFRLSM